MPIIELTCIIYKLYAITIMQINLHHIQTIYNICTQHMPINLYYTQTACTFNKCNFHRTQTVCTHKLQPSHTNCM